MARNVHFNITMESNIKEDLSALSRKTGGWQDHSTFFMESRPRLSMFKKAAKELGLKIKEIEQLTYNEMGVELDTKIIFPKSKY